ncbi:Chemotaxis regulator - transmits chemoreceptor signals to flagelllar motor component CheY [Candidatus Burkholderia pumila]|uniref:Chemotaxis regulator-transmits chemoreceptor signals to flagelllar motor component CheY n=1 Tax=Candidatus Burkholderia pumila TaxID=1090375 RepID=A0ABR5HMK2_9BURK|nr:Chemotaxis regulator - transmits chemoreceptor signals to flagelllar motor component CheY [Candidatus Burkholderia pumila]
MNKNILAIDDSAAMRQILSATLTQAGYEVTVASDGNESLEWALAERFDLVLTTESGKTFKDSAREAGAMGENRSIRTC